MTPFSLLIQVCGLSLAEAATFLNVRKDSAASYASGRRTPRPDLIEQLRDLYDMLVNAAAETADQAASLPDDAEIVMGYPADDHEAQAMGFPCVGACRAMAGMVVAELDRPVTFVPRGSTIETAAAADAHGL